MWTPQFCTAFYIVTQNRTRTRLFGNRRRLGDYTIGWVGSPYRSCPETWQGICVNMRWFQADSKCRRWKSVPFGHPSNYCSHLSFWYTMTPTWNLPSDPSSCGVGAVRTHRMPDGTERTSWEYLLDITTTEKKYFQQGKEVLAWVIGVKLFHNYSFGCHFTLCTGHKPLLSLFSEQMAISVQTSGLIQR